VTTGGVAVRVGCCCGADDGGEGARGRCCCCCGGICWGVTRVVRGGAGVGDEVGTWFETGVPTGLADEDIDMTPDADALEVVTEAGTVVTSGEGGYIGGPARV